MITIFCPECGHEINHHQNRRFGSDAGCLELIDNEFGVFCDCELTPQDIAAHCIAQTLEEAIEIAKSYRAEHITEDLNDLLSKKGV